MAGRLAIDFGTSNTVIARWNEALGKAETLHLAELGRMYSTAEQQISVVPSLIHYAEDNRRWIGNQVLQKNLYQSQRTFRWMKRYILNRSPMRIRLGDQEITPARAAADFLSTIFLFASQEIDLQTEEIAFTAPVEAYEHYESWLTDVAEKAGLQRYRLIDEPSAAALGYGAHIQPGNAYLIFDFGGGTLHASVVVMEEQDAREAGRRCRVLGKAGRDVGGTTIDQWLFAELLTQNHKSDSDADIRRISNLLLVECEKAKEALSFEEQAEISVIQPDTGALLSLELTRSRFEELLDRHDLYAEVDQTIRSALNTAAEKGYNQDSIHSVLMVGGTSQIPSVQRVVRQIFGKDRVRCEHPLDAIATGAAAFISGVDFYDHIQHDYAIRYVNPATGQYAYKTIVERGTPYPTREPAARLTVKASHDGQKKMGLAIFELGENHHRSAQPGMELVFDPTGAARLMPVSASEQERRSLFWMNENSPTFLNVEGDVAQGEARFSVEFDIDENKRLTVTSRDVKSGKLIYQRYPVVKLT